MADDHFDESGSRPRPSPRRRPDGGQSAPVEDGEAQERKQPESDSSDSLGKDLRRVGQVDHRDEEEVVFDAEPVTHEELTHILSSVWIGPTPSPDTLKKFKEIDASFAERAFAMSEQSVAASNEEKVILARGDVSTLRRGQYVSGGLTVVFVIASIVLYLLSGDPWLSGLALAAPIFQYLGKFIRTVRNDESDKIDSETPEN